jgi:hypothetical protein
MATRSNCCRQSHEFEEPEHIAISAEAHTATGGIIRTPIPITMPPAFAAADSEYGTNVVKAALKDKLRPTSSEKPASGQ